MKALVKLAKKIFNPRPIDDFVSDADKFLEKFDSEHPENEHAAKERLKHEKIFHLRDHAVKQDNDSKIWKEF